MKKILFFILFLTGCSTVSYMEERQLNSLAEEGITLDRPVDDWTRPNKVLIASLLNILPGFGNFYLGTGKGSEGIQFVYGVLNALSWPLSVVWSIPQTAIDAENLNKKDFVYYYNYDVSGLWNRQRAQKKKMDIIKKDSNFSFEDKFQQFNKHY